LSYNVVFVNDIQRLKPVKVGAEELRAMPCYSELQESRRFAASVHTEGRRERILDIEGIHRRSDWHIADSPACALRKGIEVARAKKIKNITETAGFQKAGSSIASMYGPMSSAALSDWFAKLFPGYSTGQEWESFKLGYIAGLWNGAEELAAPVFVADTNPDEHRSTDAVSFITLAYITDNKGKLELLDQHTESMSDQAG
jgi:hypothetical protein